MAIVYPVARLLAEPRLIYAAAEYLNDIDGDLLKEAFLTAVEYAILYADGGFDSAEEVKFHYDEEDENILYVSLDNGTTVTIEMIDPDHVTHVVTQQDLDTVSGLFSKLVKAIEDTDPSLKDDVSLSQIPSQANRWLCSEDGNFFVGDFHLRSDPDKRFSYKISVTDADTCQLSATIKPILDT